MNNIIRFYLTTDLENMIYISDNVSHIPRNGDMVCINSSVQYRVVDRIFFYEDSDANQTKPTKITYDIILTKL